MRDLSFYGELERKLSWHLWDGTEESHIKPQTRIYSSVSMKEKILDQKLENLCLSLSFDARN
jgi:hypothetical protein